MSEFRKLFDDFGLSRAAGQLEKVPKDSIRLAATEPSKEAVTRLGGRPNLPPDIDWPASQDGPLGFLAQIDLGTLPRLQDLDLPAEGSLFFFYDGKGLADQPGGDVYRVLYSDRPLAGCKPKTLPKELPKELRWKGLQLTAKKEISLPWPEDTAYQQLDLSEEEQKSFANLTGHLLESEGGPRTLHRIGGYPNYIQHDPKFEAHLKSSDLWNGIWAKSGNPSALAHFEETNRRFSEARRQHGPESASWELLLQIDSDDAAKMMWGDMGRLYFLIRKDDLSARRFEKTWMIWDCY